MEGALVLCVILLVVLVIQCGGLLNRLTRLRKELEARRDRDRDRQVLLGLILKELKDLRTGPDAGKVSPPEPAPAKAETAVKAEVKPEIKPEIKPEVKPSVQPAAEPEKVKPSAPPVPPRPQKTAAPVETVKAGAFEFVPDWITDWLFVRGKYRKADVPAEYAVATAWLIRIGVLILLFGVGFLAKYMIDHNMFPPALRVLSMFGLAVVLFAVGLKMTSTRYSAVALGLIGLSFATGYLCVFTGSRLYGLIGVPWPPRRRVCTLASRCLKT